LSPVWSLDAEERVQGCSILPVKVSVPPFSPPLGFAIPPRT
jgi:hypothetical protein